MNPHTKPQCEQSQNHKTYINNIKNRKVTIKKTATVVGTLRYKSVSVDEGASIYTDFHCTKADQPLLDKISKLKKTMNVINLNASNSAESQFPSETEKTLSKSEKVIKKKRSFFS